MKTKILIVDDLKENILALTRLIENQDSQIFSADNPDAALSLILDHDFGLALFDVQMPTMTGFELARLVRGIGRARDLPIIFVTAQSPEAKVIFEGYESGGVDVLFKPLDPHIVRSKVRVFVRLDQQSRQLAQSVGTMGRLKEEAELANVAKSRFLANMSHEIRTPLSAVLGFADILSAPDLPESERAECLASISRNGKLLLRIIDDILDLSRIEAERLSLELSDFDFEELLSDLEATLTNKASDKGISLRVLKSDSFRGRYLSDPLRIKQILLNMVGNAIKFTHQGKVTVHADMNELPVETGSLVRQCDLKFVIEDTGIGLDTAKAERLFQPFSQADSSTRRQYGGTGLGLAISKQLARNLGGDVVLRSSTLGQGSIFEVTIRAPLAPKRKLDTRPADQVDANTNEARLVGKKVLVVDDVQDNRSLVDRYLRPRGIVVGQASGGEEALLQAKAIEWDIILMDIQMPTMDGYETTRALRTMGFQRPIVALTAHAMREELDKCIKAGCDRTLTKPIAKRDLVDCLLDVLP